MQHPSAMCNTLICPSASFNEKSDHDVKLNWRRQNIHVLNNKYKEENHPEENVMYNLNFFEGRLPQSPAPTSSLYAYDCVP